MCSTNISSIRTLATPILADHEMELVELTCQPQGRELLVKLLVDKVGGVTIKDCTRMNQVVGQALDAAGIMEGSYTLEVSSPGLDRPLMSKRDFERAIGEDIKLCTKGDNGRMNDRQGRVLAVQPEALILQTPAGNITIPFTQIQSAKKVIKL